MYTYEYIKDLMFNLSKYKTQVEFAYEFSEDDDVVVQKEKEVVLMELFLENLDFDEHQIMSSKLEYNDSYDRIAGRFGGLSRVAIYKRVKKIVEKAVVLFNSTLAGNAEEIDLDNYMSKMDGDRIQYLIKNYSAIRRMINTAHENNKVTDNIEKLEEDFGKLRFVVDNLNGDDMKIIKQCYFAQMSISKVAHSMHMSVSTVRRRRDSAVREIQTRMYKEVDKNN